MASEVKKIVLAYSGGLDTSRHPALAQGDATRRARSSPSRPNWARATSSRASRRRPSTAGPTKCVVKDLRQEFAEQYCFPMLKAGAVYEHDYLLGTSIARPLIAKEQVEVAHADRRRRRRPRRHRQGQRPGALRADLHGPGPAAARSSPRGRTRASSCASREAAVDYAEAQRHPHRRRPRRRSTRATATSGTSRHEGAELEDPGQRAARTTCWVMTRRRSTRPRTSRVRRGGLRAGRAGRASTARRWPAHELIAKLNEIGGKHGVGQVDLVENRLVGMKSRGVYETPGGTILYEAHRALEEICLDRDTLHYKQQVALQVRRAGLLRPVVPPAARGPGRVRRRHAAERHRHGAGQAASRAAATAAGVDQPQTPVLPASWPASPWAPSTTPPTPSASSSSSACRCAAGARRRPNRPADQTPGFGSP